MTDVNFYLAQPKSKRTQALVARAAVKLEPLTVLIKISRILPLAKRTGT